MSFNKCYESQDFTKYDQMSTEELGKILEAEPLKPREDQLPDDELLYISEVYCNRFDMQKIFPKTNEEYLAEFTTLRASLSEEDLSLLLEQEEADAKETLAVLKQVSKRKSTKHTRRLPVRKLAVIAATVAVAFSLIMLPVNASGNSVLDTIVIWAKETFQFISLDKIPTEDFVEDTQFQDFLLQHGITTSVPCLIPKGYTLVKTKAQEETDSVGYSALYQLDEESFLSIIVDAIIPGKPGYVEQSGDTYETLKISGTEYFLFCNLGKTVAVWNSNSYQHVITAPISKEEMKIMLYSIPKE